MGAHWWFVWQGMQVAAKEMQIRYKENNVHREGGHMWGQVALWGCEITVLGDVQNLSGHGPEQPYPTSKLGLLWAGDGIGWHPEVPSNLRYLLLLIKKTEIQLSGIPVCTLPCREMSLLLTTWPQRLFPETLRKVSPSSSSSVPWQSQHKASSQLPDTASARAQHTAFTVGTNKSGGPSVPLPTCHSCGRWHTFLCDVAELRQGFSPQRIWKSTAKIVTSEGIHAAALVSLDLTVIKICWWYAF